MKLVILMYEEKLEENKKGTRGASGKMLLKRFRIVSVEYYSKRRII